VELGLSRRQLGATVRSVSAYIRSHYILSEILDMTVTFVPGQGFHDLVDD